MTDSKTLLMMGSRLMGQMDWRGQTSPPDPLNTGTTDAIFQLEGNTDFDRHRLYNFDRTGDS